MTESSVEQAHASRLVLAVRLGKDLHAIPIRVVEEVLPALPIESVPNCPTCVRGVVFVRGHLIPVLDAAERLGLIGHERPLEPHIVCLKIEDRLIGVEFDEALDLMDLGPVELLSAAELGASAGFCSGVVERDGQVIRILDPHKLTDIFDR
ncbi:MAG TPA: chemotaxis protein CheW [Pirellulaceae bacterium]|nr:chemotaxis protein CheW [Pirellulaceae bacterium]